MNAAELVKLSLAGYKAAEIKELKGMEKETPEALTLALNGNSLTDVKELLTLTATEDGTKPEVVTADRGKRDPEPDYKSMYEELKKKSDDLENTIKEIQNKNQSTPGPDLPSEEDQIAEIVKGFM